MHASKLIRRRHGIGSASITAGFWDVVGVFGALGAVILFIGEKQTNELRADSQKLEAKIEAFGQKMEAKIEAFGQKMEAKIEAVGQKLEAKMESDRQKLEAKMESIGSDIRDALAGTHTR